MEQDRDVARALLREAQHQPLEESLPRLYVVEHFSYHTGQVVKALENVDLGCYADRDLNQRNRV